MGKSTEKCESEKCESSAVWKLVSNEKTWPKGIGRDGDGVFLAQPVPRSLEPPSSAPCYLTDCVCFPVWLCSWGINSPSVAPSLGSCLNKKFSGVSSSEWLLEGVASLQSPSQLLKELVWMKVNVCIFIEGLSQGRRYEPQPPTPHICISELSLMMMMP